MKRSRFFPALFFYAACVAAFHRQVLARPSTIMLGGSTVGGIFSWEFHWFKKALLSSAGLNPFFTTDVMFPVGTPVILESPLVAAAGTLLHFVFTPAASVNFLFLGAYALAGISMFLLADALFGDALASLLAGFVFMFSQYALTQHALGHLHEACVGFVPLFLLGLLRLESGVTPKRLLLLFIGAAGVMLSSVYMAFSTFIVAFPIFFVASFSGERRARATHRELALVVACAAAIILIGAIAYAPVLAHHKDLVGGKDSYALGLSSFFDFPFWHPDPWVQRLRSFTSAGEDRTLLASAGYLSRTEYATASMPENLMGFFGITVFVFALAGWFGKFSRRRVWLLLGVTGAVLSLGPHLKWAHHVTPLPLPYRLFQYISVLREFRAPARMILLAWVSASVFVAAGFRFFTRTWPIIAKVGLLSAALGLFCWETGVRRIGLFSTPLNVSEAYQKIKDDAVPGALLELPAAIDSSKEISLNTERYMMYAPFHGRPLVLGRPARYTAASLQFCENMDVFFELTHPAALKKIQEDPAYAPRLDALKNSARRVFRDSGVRYVLFHQEDSFFSIDVLRRYRWFLDAVLGPPVFEDAKGLVLYAMVTS